jgi:chromosome partitioning protein
LSEAPSHGKSILDYDPKSIGAQKYLDLAHELDAKVFGKFGNEPEVSVEQTSMRDEHRSNSELRPTDSPNYAENEANV